MIPSEVGDIADLIFPQWRESDAENEVLTAAWRIYNAGYRKIEQSDHVG